MRDIVSELISRVNDEKKLLAETVSVGSVINWEQYQRLVGRNEGLQMSLDILNQILTEDSEEL